MYATYQIKAEELNMDFFTSIKETFKGKDIEISINGLRRNRVFNAFAQE